MTQEENVQDTQNPSGSIEDEIIQGTKSVNEEAFGLDEAAANIVTGGEVPTTDTPAQPSQPAPQVQGNEETRFNYWQSEADKAKNTIQMQNRELEALRSYRDHVETQPQQAPTQEQPQEEEVVFPEPPAKPEAPVGYNKQESYDEPNSASARYDSELDTWRDNMTQYNTLHSQFMLAKQQEDYDAKIGEMKKVEARREAREQQGRQMQQIHSYVGDKYGLSPDEATEFVKVVENRTGLKIGCLEEIALNYNWISKAKLINNIRELKGVYYDYLKRYK